MLAALVSAQIAATSSRTAASVSWPLVTLVAALAVLTAVDATYRYGRRPFASRVTA